MAKYENPILPTGKSGSLNWTCVADATKSAVSAKSTAVAMSFRQSLVKPWDTLTDPTLLSKV
jgi:hypothetical protein